jgi:hypothetical protein
MAGRMAPRLLATHLGLANEVSAQAASKGVLPQREAAI